MYALTQRKYLGSGTYGVVYDATHIPTGQAVAVKRLLASKEKQDVHTGSVFAREVSFMLSCDDSNIAKVRQVLDAWPFKGYSDSLRDASPSVRESSSDMLYIVMDRACCTFDLLHAYDGFYANFKRAVAQCIWGLSYIHANGICHRDIKPSNILCYFNDCGVVQAKLTDFGLSKKLVCRMNSNNIVSQPYRAPELLTGSTVYNEKIDVWAMGVTFAEVLMGNMELFCGDTDNKLIKSIFATIGGVKDEVWKHMSRSLEPCKKPTQKPQRYKLQKDHVNWANILRLSKENVAAFNKQNTPSMVSPGTYKNFSQLLNKMLVVDPSLRSSAQALKKANMFSRLPKTDKKALTMSRSFGFGEDAYHGLRAKLEVQCQLPHTLEINIETLEERQKIVEVIESIAEESDWIVAFLALDLCDRLMLLDEVLKEYYKDIAVVCCFIADKYYNDENAMVYFDIIPDYDPGTAEMVRLEKKFLKLCNYRIHRTLVYELIHTQKPKELFYLLAYEVDSVYNTNLTVADIAESFDSNISPCSSDDEALLV